MDSSTATLVATAILTAASSGVTAGVGDVSKKAVVDTYNGLKAIFVRKFGNDNKITKAIESLEKDNTPDQQDNVKKEVAALIKDDDPNISEIKKTAQQILHLTNSITNINNQFNIEKVEKSVVVNNGNVTIS